MAIYYSDKIKDVYDPRVTKSVSRYKTKKRLVNSKNETVIRFIRSRDLTFDSETSVIHVVKSVEAFRPDLIAYKYYGSSRYAWIILAANDLPLPYQLTPGLKIIVPGVAQLQGAKGKLVTN